MSTNLTGDPKIDDKNPLCLPKTIPKDYLKRLVLLDGFNLMHFPNPLPSTELLWVPADERMNPMILVPMIMNLISFGYAVRLVLRNMPRESRCSNLYILDVLESLDLILYPVTDGPENDDRLMLDIAKKFGAIIISNDQFRNHRQYKRQAEENTIRYEIYEKKNYDQVFQEMLIKEELTFNQHILFVESADKLLVHTFDDEYSRVAESMKIFNLTADHVNDAMLKLSMVLLFIYSNSRYIYGYELPDQIYDFLPDEEDFPLAWWKFRSYYTNFFNCSKKLKMFY